MPMNATAHTRFVLSENKWLNSHINRVYELKCNEKGSSRSIFKYNSVGVNVALYFAGKV